MASPLTFNFLKIPGYEQVVEAVNPQLGLHVFIAIHNTTLGPSLGGLRMFPYATREDALEDALLLSKAMTLKSALAETGLGGGKSVMIGNPKTDKTKDLFHEYGKILNTLNGAYIAAEDVGITEQDLLFVREASPYVAALPLKGSSGDPSRFTAFGIYQGILAVAKTCFGSETLKGKKIAIQGLGNVGSKLARFLFWEGADLLLSDLDAEKLERECRELQAIALQPDEIYQTPCDIFSPCAMGGILNQNTISKLKCKAIAGSTNNQLQTPEDGILLQQKNILYAPDFVINAGGIINASAEFRQEGYLPKWALNKTNQIYGRLIEIFKLAEKTGKTPEAIAIDLALKKLPHPK